MNLTSIFEDAFLYPLRNLKELAILIVFVAFLLFGLGPAFYDYGLLYSIVFLVPSLFLVFVSLNIFRNTINGSDGFLNLNYNSNIPKNIFDIIKLVILVDIYYIIPFLTAMLFDVYTDYAVEFFATIVSFISLSPMFVFGIPKIGVNLELLLLRSDLYEGQIAMVIFLYFLATFLFLAAKFELAKTGSFIGALTPKNILTNIQNIGLYKYIFSIFTISILIFCFFLFLELSQVFYMDSLPLPMFLFPGLFAYFLIFNSRFFGLLFHYNN
ncbi:MAG: hypothetical protein ACRC1M_02740 [Methanobacteriaceae archaeon]